MRFILQILHFSFLPVKLDFFGLSAQFSFVFLQFFLALAQTSLNIFQKFQRILKEGLNALHLKYDKCMYAKKKNRPKKALFYQTQKKHNFFLFFDWGQPNSNLVFIFILGRSSLILSKFGPKIKKIVFFAVDPIGRKFYWIFSHLLIFSQFFQNVDFKASIQLF